MKNTFILIALILNLTGLAQTWSPVGALLDSTDAGRNLYVHSNGHLFATFNKDGVNGSIKMWDGINLNTFSQYAQTLSRITEFDTQFMVSVALNSAYKTNGVNWNNIPLGTISPQSITKYNGLTYLANDENLYSGTNINNLKKSDSITIYQHGQVWTSTDSTSLFIHGWVSYNDSPVFLAEYNGTYWKTYPFPTKADELGYSISATHYNGSLYATGVNVPTGVSKLYKWDGSKWITLWSISNLEEPSKLTVYDNCIYFTSNIGTPYDKATLHKFDGKLVTDVQVIIGRINDMVLYKKELYVCGQFTKIGTRKLINIAKFSAKPIGIFENQLNRTINIYPNPTQGQFTIDSDNGIATLTIYNSIGQIILTKQINGKEVIELPLDSKQGVYIVQTIKDNVISTTKLVKE